MYVYIGVIGVRVCTLYHVSPKNLNFIFYCLVSLKNNKPKVATAQETANITKPLE